MRLALALALAFAGCRGDAPSSLSEQACAQQIKEDPSLRDVLLKSTQPEWLWQNAAKIDIAKQQAMIGCLQSRGAKLRGGVEPPR